MKANELRSKELRIGNFVNYKYFNPNPKNSGWEFEIVEMIGILKDDFYFKFRNNSKTNKIKELHPIPLTEEWLVNFGFEYNSFVDSYQFGNIQFLYHDSFFFKDSEIDIEIKFVHQLQNLIYALTGEELTIKTK